MNYLIVNALIYSASIVAGVVLLLITAVALRSSTLPKCPHCSRFKVRPSHRRGLIDHTLSFLGLPPFRCMACLKRFHAFRRRRPGAHEPAPEMQ